MTVERILVKLDSVSRLANTPNGNPRWELFTDKGNFKTYPDSQCAYNIQSYVGKDVVITVEGTLRRVRDIYLPSGHADRMTDEGIV